MDREDDIVVADGGDTTTWMGMTRTVVRAGHYLDYGIYGSLAVGLPYANAAKLLSPEKQTRSTAKQRPRLSTRTNRRSG